MIDSIKRYAAIIFISILWVHHLKPLSETMALAGGVAGGAATGILAGYGSKFIMEKNGVSSATATVVLSLAAIGTGSLVGYYFYNYLYTFTPSSRFKAANVLYTEAETLYREAAFLDGRFVSEEMLYDFAIANFGTGWPKNIGTVGFDHLNTKLNAAQGLVSEASKAIKQLGIEEPSWSASCSSFATQSGVLAKKITTLKAVYEASQSYLMGSECLKETQCDPLLEKYFTSECTLHEYATAHFEGNWPMVLAHKRFMELKQQLVQARAHFQKSIAVAKALHAEGGEWNARCAKIINFCIDELNNVAILEVFREDRTVALKASEKFDFQTKLYEQHQELERQRKHAQELAEQERKHREEETRLQREHERQLEIARLAHESHEKRQERFLQEKRDEKKYVHQQNILANTNNRPVTLNVG